MSRGAYGLHGLQAWAEGFTFIELITVTVVMGIVLAIAVPNFADLVRSSRMTTQANDLMADLLYARSEAAARG